MVARALIDVLALAMLGSQPPTGALVPTRIDETHVYTPEAISHTHASVPTHRLMVKDHKHGKAARLKQKRNKGRGRR